jgi:saccharopine dehydrogenase-like NADP-dependent oxidoreductase
MKKQPQIIIAGAGGIAEAAALILAEWSPVEPEIYIGNRTLEKARKVAEWVEAGATKPCSVHAFHLPQEGLSEEAKAILQKSDILLDCLPGSLAPKMAQLALDFELHYVNLTEYVAETDQIIDMAKGASTGFVLQTGLAPGYIGVLAHDLFLDFCRDFEVEKVDKLEFKVGALTDHAVPPHFYGFTWSPVGVATEYVEDAIVIRDFKKTTLPSLSEREALIIDGIAYEADLTSGGAADLPDALAGKVRKLDYKTLRHPGHYDWVQRQLAGQTAIAALQQKMEDVIPHIEDDRVVLYAAVEGKDALGVLRRREVAKRILPQTVGRHRLRAIQTTTAVPMLQAAWWLLENNQKGVFLQSQIEPKPFLNGHFVTKYFVT